MIPKAALWCDRHLVEALTVTVDVRALAQGFSRALLADPRWIPVAQGVETAGQRFARTVSSLGQPACCWLGDGTMAEVVQRAASGKPA